MGGTERKEATLGEKMDFMREERGNFNDIKNNEEMGGRIRPEAVLRI